MTFGHRLGIRFLPSYLIQYGEKALLIQIFSYDDFVFAIDEISDRKIKPAEVKKSIEKIRELIQKHPLISPIEIKEAFDFESVEAVREYIQPLTDIEIVNVHHGWFIKKKGYYE